MYCSNCGAEISPDDKNCPYCGMLNAYGAEKHYMRKLEDIRQQTEDLEDVPEQEMTGQVKKQGRKVAMVVGILAIVVLVFAVVGVLMETVSRRQGAAANKDKLAFQRQYFDELEAIYESGDDAAVYQFIMDHVDEKGGTAFYSWPHSTYYFSIYPVTSYLETYREAVEKGEADSEDLGYLLYWVMEVLYDSYYDLEVTDPRDAAHMEEVRTEARVFLTDDLGLTQEEQDALFERVKDSSDLEMPATKKCLKEAEILWKNNN